MWRTLWAVAVIFAVTTGQLTAGDQRKWTDTQGNVITAEFLGMSDDIVVLRHGISKTRVPLSQLSPDDQAYVQQQMKERARTGSAAQPALDAEIQAIVDSIPQPSQDLLEQDLLRIWTDTKGNAVTAKFVAVDENGQVTLRDDAGRTQPFPLVSFSREDLEFIRDRIAKDASREVFPPGDFTPLTPAQIAAGETTWTDRNGVRFNGKVSGKSGLDKVVIASGEQKLMVPVKGLSEADQLRIDAELERQVAMARAEAERQRAEYDRRLAENEQQRAEANRQRAEAMRQQMEQNRQRLESIASRTDTYSYPPSSSHTSPSAPRVPSYSPPNYDYMYQFHCDRCGHRWTDSTRSMMQCPKCTSSRSNNVGSSSTSESGGRPTGDVGLIVRFVVALVSLFGIGFLIKRLLP